MLACIGRIEKNADGTFTVSYKSGDKEDSVQAGLVMFGTGRKPNTRGIGLEVHAKKKCPEDTYTHDFKESA